MPGGPWSITNPPKRPGSYMNWKYAGQPVITPNLSSIVAIPFTHDWGPLATPVTSTSWAEWQGVFGESDTPGSRAVKQSFFGEGLPGYGGAEAVLSYRLDSTASPATAASVTLKASGTGTPDALTLTAKYAGTFANALRITVQTNAQDEGSLDLVIMQNQTVLETYTFETDPTGSTPVANVANLINEFSGFVNATVVQDGVAPQLVSSVPLTDGTDGTTLTVADWTAMLDAIQPERFAILSPYDLTDDSIHTAFVTWCAAQNNGGKRLSLWTGGALNESITDALTRASSANEPNTNTLGIGSVVDEGIVGTPEDPVVLSTSQLAPRAAGIYAARGGIKPMTYARLAGCLFAVQTSTGVVKGRAPSDSEIIQAIGGGVIPIARDSNVASPLRFEKGVSTYQSTNTDPDRPYVVYSSPKFMKVMQDFEMALNQIVQDEVITPGLPITQSTKEFVLGEANNLLETMETGQLIQSGWSVTLDASIPSTPTDDFIAIAYSWTFTRPAEKVYNTVVVS